MTKKQSNIEDTLTDRQKCFVMEFLISNNRTQAALKAGYSKKTASIMGAKLTNEKQFPRVVEVIRTLRKQDEKRFKVTRQTILEQLYYMLTRDVGEFINEDGTIANIKDMPKAARCMIDGFEQVEYTDPETGEKTLKTKVRLSPKAQAVDLSMKYKGMLAPDKHTLTTTINWDELLDQRKKTRKPIVEVEEPPQLEEAKEQ